MKWIKLWYGLSCWSLSSLLDKTRCPLSHIRQGFDVGWLVTFSPCPGISHVPHCHKPPWWDQGHVPTHAEVSKGHCGSQYGDAWPRKYPTSWASKPRPMLTQCVAAQHLKFSGILHCPVPSCFTHLIPWILCLYTDTCEGSHHLGCISGDPHLQRSTHRFPGHVCVSEESWAGAPEA